MAWLHSPAAQPGGNPTGSTAMCRAQQLQADGQRIYTPPVTVAYLCNYLDQIGLTQSNGFGLSPLSPADILGWQQGTATPLAPWEFDLLLAASRAYVNYPRSADQAPPCAEQITTAQPDVIDRRLRAGFASLAQPTGRKAQPAKH